MKDKSIIFLIVLAALILGYFMIFYSKITFEMKREILRVNIHDTIDLKNQILKAQDNNRKNLLNKVKISVEISDNDKYEDGKLYIGDFSSKTVTYTLKYKFKTTKRELEIVVITDPNDSDFRPNYDYESNVVNNDDVPNNQINTNLTDKQKQYVESLLR